MEQAYYSIKQMADHMGLPKQRVYRCIKANRIVEAHRDTVNGNTVLMYSKSDFDRIKTILQKSTASSEAHHEVHREVHHDTDNDALYKALLKQLEIKDKQIAQLQAIISDNEKKHHEALMQAQKNLDQAQQLHAVDRQKLLKLDAKDDIVSDSERGPEPSKSFWRRLFRRNN